MNRTDPEAEQEVDFGRYARALAARWWVVLAGFVIGALVGYVLSVGGNPAFKATSTIYLGQPYTASGNVQLQSAQTNPSTVRTIARSEAAIAKTAAVCKVRPGDFRAGISTQTIAGNLARNGQTPLVSLSVQTKKRREAACVANELAKIVVDRTSAFANQKIANFQRQIELDERRIAVITQALERGGLSATEQLLLQLRLGPFQSDRLSTSQLLLQAQQVEKPSVLTVAVATKVTARSRRNTVVVSALIGLIIGAIAALMWDGVAAGLSRRGARE